MIHLIALAALAVPHMDRYGDPLPPGAIARFGTVRFRTGEARAAELSADGKTLAVETAAGLTLWDVESGRPRARVAGRPEADTTCLSPDGRFTVRVFGPEIRIHDGTTGAWRSRLRFAQDVGVLGFFPGTTRLAINAGPDKSVSVYDVASGRKVSTLAVERAVGQLAPSGRYFLGVTDQTPYLVDAATGKVRTRFPCEGRGRYSNHALTADDRLLCESDVNGRFRVFAADTGKLLADLVPPWTNPSARPYGQVTVSPDGAVAYLATSGEPGLRRDLKAGRWLPSLPELPGDRLLPHPDGKRVLLLDDDGLLRRYDLATLKEIPLPDGFTRLDRARPSLSGRRVAVTGYGADGYRLQVFNATGRELWARRPSPYLTVAWAPDGRRLACVGDDRIRLCDAATGKAGPALPLAADAFAFDAAFTPDGTRLFVALQGQGLATFDLAANKQTVVYGVGDGAGFDLAPGGRLVLSHPAYGTSLLDPAAGRQIVEWTGDEFVPNNYDPPRARCSPDGSFVLSWDFEGRTYVRDPTTLAVRQRFRTGHPGAAFRTAISPNGLWLAVGTADGRLSLWDIASGCRLCEWHGHLAAVTGVAFAGPGRVVTSSADRTALLWDLQPREKPMVPAGYALAGPWPAEAYRAVWALATDPKSPDLLGRLVRPTPTPAAEQVRRWLADLAADRFVLREAATKELRFLGPLVRSELNAERARTKSEEARTRLDALLGEISWERTPAEVVQARVVAAMELAGTPAARRLLAEWAAGAPGARLTTDAKAALGRLGDR